MGAIAAVHGLQAGFYAGTVPGVLLRQIEAVVRDARTTSDTLLIVADALREAAAQCGPIPPGPAIAHLANTLTDLAPGRATPVAAREPGA